MSCGLMLAGTRLQNLLLKLGRPVRNMLTEGENGASRNRACGGVSTHHEGQAVNFRRSCRLSSYSVGKRTWFRTVPSVCVDVYIHSIHTV
eukprot:6193880-Pleurochrysis_carterae.AAC.3